ncbi:MAG: polysaccharide deacetylase family protein, partial [Methylomarinum sp.]|nr:polysaccharide deacetylase family protein [Methylomarinum sp.]
MNKFIILMYHMISDPKSPEETKYACPAERFEKHMQQLKRNGFTPVSLDQIEQSILLGKPLSEKSFAITLDDGFEDNYTNAFPILTQHNIPATIFLASGCIGLTNKWMTSRNFPSRKMLDWQQIKEMQQHNISFGAHTVSHPKLPELDDEAATNEIIDSKKTIEEKLGIACKHFAYPYGLFNTANRDSVESSGFTLACSTRSGFNNANRDPFVLHRIEVYGDDPWWKLKQKMTFGINDASLFFPLKYYTSRLVHRFTKNSELLNYGYQYHYLFI